MLSARARYRIPSLLRLIFCADEVRRHADRSILRQLTLFSLLLLLFNIMLIFAVTHEDVFEFLKEQVMLSLLDDRDIAVVACIVFSAVGLITAHYVLQMHRLIKDIQQLAAARDRAIEVKSQRQKLEALGQLSAGISHEINTCLQSILVSCELARNSLGSQEILSRCLDKAVRNSYHARRVIENVLAFSEQGGTMQLAEYAIEGLFTDAVDYSRTFLPVAIEVKTMVGQDIEMVRVDRSAFIHIIQNLLNNAAHAMDFAGLIRLSCLRMVEMGNHNLYQVKPGFYAECLVTDTGHGMSKEVVEKIFEPFFSTKHGQGTGLGLSIVYGMVMAMGGHISVMETSSRGTVFRLLLPTIRTLP